VGGRGRVPLTALPFKANGTSCEDLQVRGGCNLGGGAGVWVTGGSGVHY